MWYHYFSLSSCICIGFLLNLFQILLSCGRTHLHIAVVHITAYNICIICCRVLEIILFPGVVFCSSTMILFTLPYPLFIFYYCFICISYIRRIIHWGFYTIWSWSISILPYFEPVTFQAQAVSIYALCLVHKLRCEVSETVSFHYSVTIRCLCIGFILNSFQTLLSWGLICILQ